MGRTAWIFGLLSSILMATVPVSAQVSSDGSTGTIVAPNGNVFDITGGTTVGGRNLFHSFDRFDVPTLGAANFLNDPSIVNIFSRVTGGKVSEIDGVLRSRGSANFFLMNPSGIVFKENASLDVGGSFVATTANGIQFGDRGSFSASPSVPNPVLEIDPSAFLFNSSSTPAAIDVRSQGFAGLDPIGTSLILGLRVPDQRSIVLAGGDVRLQDGNLYAFDGGIELGGLAASGAIAISNTGERFQIQFPENAVRANVTLTNSLASVRARGTGAIKLYANDVTLRQESALRAGVLAGLNGSFTQVGNLEIDAKGQVTLDNSDFSNLLNQGGTGRAGNIQITANALTIAAGSQIIATTAGQGDAGSIGLNIRDRTTVQGINSLGRSSAIASGVFTNAIGKSGAITLETGSLSISQGGSIYASTFGQGDAGSIVINAKNNLQIDGELPNGLPDSPIGGIFSVVGNGGIGNGGNLQITARTLEVTNGGLLSSDTFNGGKAGDINVTASERASFIGTSTIGRPSSARAPLNSGVGESGSISVNTPVLVLKDGGNLLTTTAGIGKAGNIVVNAPNSVVVEGNQRGQTSLIASGVLGIQTGNLGVGDSGNVEIKTRFLTVADGASIATSTGGIGKAGNIVINAQDEILVDSKSRADGSVSSIQSAVAFGARGEGGNIQISTDKLSLLNGAQISSETSGDGDAGNIAIDKPTTKVLINGSSSLGLLSGIRSVSTFGSTGKAGNILLNVDSLMMTDRGFITSGTTEVKNAGSITINAVNDVILSGGVGQTRTAIDSRTTGAGRGGDITITGRNITIQESAGLSSSSSDLLTSENGDAGNIKLDARNQISIRGSQTRNGLSTVILTQSGGQAKSGDLTMIAPNIEIADGAFTSTATTGTGAAGNVTINAANQITLFGSVAGIPSFIASSTGDDATGKGGTITLKTGSLSLLDGATLSTSSLGTGQAGDIEITTQDSVVIRGGTGQGAVSSLLSNSTAQGAGGKISVRARSLFLEQGGQINSASSGSGVAGDIFINVSDLFQARNGRVATTAANASGGAVTINAGAIRLLDRSSVATVVLSGSGKGGDITFDADTIVAIEGSDVLAFADLERGQGGNIRFRTDAFVRPLQANIGKSIVDREALIRLVENGQVDINASGSVGGAITGISDITFLQNSLTELPQNAIDTNALLANSCITRNQQNGAFYITGTGGLPTNPGELATYSTGTVQPANAANSWKRGDEIVEPQGVYQLPNGALILSRECVQN